MGYCVTSLRAGGKYHIDDTNADLTLNDASTREKVLLTTWLVEQRRLGVTCPKITGSVFDDVKKRKLPSVHERADNLLRYLNQKSELIGSVVELRRSAGELMDYNMPGAVNHGAGGYGETMAELLAWTSSQQLTEVITLAEYCDEQNWITLNTPNPTSPSGDITLYEIMLKPAGYARLAKLDGANPDSAQGFIAMWFDDSMNDVHKDGFEPAIRCSGYKPFRIDDDNHNEKIDDHIIAEIRRSRFVVADFTSKKDEPRANVFYEAGFAQGLNIPVIWTCKQDTELHKYFDTRQYNHIMWKDPEDLRDKLTMRIRAVIGDGPLQQ